MCGASLPCHCCSPPFYSQRCFIVVRTMRDTIEPPSRERQAMLAITGHMRWNFAQKNCAPRVARGLRALADRLLTFVESHKLVERLPDGLKLVDLGGRVLVAQAQAAMYELLRGEVEVFFNHIVVRGPGRLGAGM